MDEKKLIIPKGDGTLEMAIASIEIYYKYNDWISNDFFREKLIEKYPDFKNKDSAFLLHKARTARYFGLIEYLYKKEGEIQGRQGRITTDGKRFYEGYLAQDELIVIDTIMDCINKYTFGRYNYGIEGDSNVEMPRVLLKASIDLEYISKDESVAILYYMHDEDMEYKDAIKKIKKLRDKDIDSLNDVPKGFNIENRYGDNKAAQLMREINIFEDNTSKYKLNRTVEEKYIDFIKGLDTKRYRYEEIDIEVDKSAEGKSEYLDIKKLDNIKTTQKIYFGPPGTGKSYNVTEEILEHQIKVELIPETSKEYNSDFVYRTTIYPEYNYYDFIGNIMPVVEGENITYDFKPGIFTLALSKALEVLKNKIPVYLVIEEMSRGNIAGVFGDIFQLLDRDVNGISEYKIDNDIISDYLSNEQIYEYQIESEESTDIKKEIYLPSNLNILGTVNTSDQNVFVMDTAFKRRFEFEYVDTDPVADENGDLLNEYKFMLEGYKYKWNDFYKQLNDYIVSELGLPEDKQIGQFFIKFDKKTNKENYQQIQNKLLPYLWDDIHLISISNNSLFKTKYKSFSKAYIDFGNNINVFNDSFIDKLSPGKTISYTLEDESTIISKSHEGE